MATGPNNGQMVPINPDDLAKLQQLQGKEIDITWIRSCMRFTGSDPLDHDPVTSESGTSEHQINGVLKKVNANTITIKTPDGVVETLAYREEGYLWRVGYIEESGNRWIASLATGGQVLRFMKDAGTVRLI